MGHQSSQGSQTLKFLGFVTEQYHIIHIVTMKVFILSALCLASALAEPEADALNAYTYVNYGGKMMPVTRYNGFRPHEVRPNTYTGFPNTFTGFPNTYTRHPNTYTGRPNTYAGYAVGVAALPGVASHPGGATSFTYRSPQGLKA